MIDVEMSLVSFDVLTGCRSGSSCDGGGDGDDDDGVYILICAKALTALLPPSLARPLSPSLPPLQA